MSNARNNALLWWGSLLLAEWLTWGIWNWVISSLIWNTANAVFYWLNNIWNGNHLLEQWVSQIWFDAPLASSTTSILGNFILPGALGIWSAYIGLKKYKNQWGIKWAYNWLEASALTYWSIGLIWGWVGLLSAPFVAPVLAWWLWMYGIKKLAQAANDNVSKINPMNLIKKDTDKAA